MLIDISQLDRKAVRLDARVEITPFAWEGGQTVRCRPARLAGVLAPTSRGLELTARVETLATLQCTRCLETFEVPIDAEFRLRVVPVESEAEAFATAAKDDPDAIDVYPLAGEQLDLAEVLREQVDLQLPLTAVCRPECKGLCPVCGADRNRETCRCASEGDARWAPLADIREILEKNKGPGPSRGR